MPSGAGEAPKASTARVCDVISTFRPVKFRPEDGQQSAVLSLDFDDTGEYVVIARNDDTLHLYNCKDGKSDKLLRSQKYGVDLARFTHHTPSILYASTKIDDTIRYLSTHDNSYIRYYHGHTGAVTTIELCPGDDTFLSCSVDNTVRLWALNTPNCTGMLRLHSPLLAAYDPSASVIAIASPPTQSILLYDLRNFDRAPFATFDLQAIESRFGIEGVAKQATPRNKFGHPNDKILAGRNVSDTDSSNKDVSLWTRISFSNDGKCLLVSTAGMGHYVLDAFDGSLRAYLAKRGWRTSSRLLPGERDSSGLSGRGNGETNLSELKFSESKSSVKGAPNNRTAYSQGDTCWSPDGRYVIGGGGILSEASKYPSPYSYTQSASMGTGELYDYTSMHQQSLLDENNNQDRDGSLLVWDVTTGNFPNTGSTASLIEQQQSKRSDGNVLNPSYSLSCSVLPNSSSSSLPASSNCRQEVVGYNPRFNMMVSADTDVLFWLPDSDFSH